jgi:predicted nucleic acid-binding protein
VIAYVDTSALLRLVLREPGGLEELRSCEALVSSELIAVESLRAIDRLRLQGVLSTEEAASRRETATEWLEAVDLVLLQRPILARASEPLPTPLGTLDALHLSTALVWQDRMRQKLVMATHDRDLALAARSFGLDVRGVGGRRRDSDAGGTTGGGPANADQ